jgi:hypothetical protein
VDEDVLSESAEISPTVSEDFFITDFHLSEAPLLNNPSFNL